MGRSCQIPCKLKGKVSESSYSVRKQNGNPNGKLGFWSGFFWGSILDLF